MSFYEKDLIPVLFQIYGALHKLRNQFTHYDLHYGNVLLTELPEYYFSYNFNTGNNVYNVHCKYMVKMIDYGRSYCEKSAKLIKDLCNNLYDAKKKRLCDRNSWNTDVNGYYWAIRNPTNQWNIISVLNNKSADLKLIKSVINYSKHESVNMIRYTQGLIQCDRIMDYEEDKTSEQQNGFPNRIRTVSDAFHALLGIINTNILIYKINSPRRKPMHININF